MGKVKVEIEENLISEIDRIRKLLDELEEMMQEHEIRAFTKYRIEMAKENIKSLGYKKTAEQRFR